MGVDIGCGMETVRIKEKHIELQKLDKLIYDKIPSGFHIREQTHRYFRELDLKELYCYYHINPERAEKSMGTLGGGNHFIEVDQDSNGNIYIVIHSGSRHLGLETAQYYQEEGYRVLNSPDEQEMNALNDTWRAQGREGKGSKRQMAKDIRALRRAGKTDIPPNLAYVSGVLFERYIHDMKIVQEYARLNRQAIMDEIVKGMKLHVLEQFTTVHNYIDTEEMILRKGAVSAKKGEKLLIPMNMRDGSLICMGKGNEDWNQSAPHGAGRLMSRSAARQSFTVSEFKKQMKGIYTTSVNQGTLDECPMAYKGVEDIVQNIGGTVEITEILKPVYNFKASGEE